jgi:MoaA/NifB/PqqE/SkfB family radical SAM enzyme
MRIQWDLTSRCNLRCPHCSTALRRRENPRELSTDTVKAILSDVAAGGVDTVLFGGGEVTLRSDLVELVDHATTQGLACWFTTNGQALGRGRIRELMRAGLGSICVSIDGSTEQTNCLIRGRGALEPALRTLAMLVEERRAQSPRTLVEVAFTLMRSNLDDAVPVAQTMAQMKVDAVSYLHLVDPRSSGFDWVAESPSPKDLLAVGFRLAEVAAENGLAMALPVPARVIAHWRGQLNYRALETTLEERCSAGLHLAFVGVDGVMVPCVAAYGLPDARRILPHDLNELSLLTHKFEAVYFSRWFSDYIAEINDPQRAIWLSDACRSCSFRLARRCQPACLFGDASAALAPRICEEAARQGHLQGWGPGC